MENEILGRYALQGELGQGGMGLVYRARHIQLEKTVALKILPGHLAADPILRARFVREARAAANLNHPHIVQVFDVDQVGDTHFFAMELIEGETLGRRLETRGALPVGEAIHIACQIADALAYAHERGIVHRDLKPANIMFDAQSEVKVADFGLAAAAGAETLTRTGEIVGTPRYMSPEQALGRDVDGRSDLFSLGLILSEMLSGRVPFEGVPLLSVVAKLMQPDGEIDLMLPEHVPSEIQAIIGRLTRKPAAERYGSAAGLLADLRRWEAGEPVTAAVGDEAPPPVAVRREAPASIEAPAPIAARGRRRLGLEVASGALVLATLGFFLWRAQTPRPIDPRAPAAGTGDWNAVRAESLRSASPKGAAWKARREVEAERRKVEEMPNPPDGATLRRAEEYGTRAEAAARSGDFAAARLWYEKARDEYRSARLRGDRR